MAKGTPMLMINETATIRSCLRDLLMLSRVRITNPMLKSIHIFSGRILSASGYRMPPISIIPSISIWDTTKVIIIFISPDSKHIHRKAVKLNRNIRMARTLTITPNRSPSSGRKRHTKPSRANNARNIPRK